MRRAILGNLPIGREFFCMGKQYRVLKHLGGDAGTSVQPLAMKEVKIGDVSFTKLAGKPIVWACSAEVEIENARTT